LSPRQRQPSKKVKVPESQRFPAGRHRRAMDRSERRNHECHSQLSFGRESSRERPWMPLPSASVEAVLVCMEGTLRTSYVAASLCFAFGLFAGAASAEVNPSLAHRSADLTQRYLHTWSTNARAALAEVPRLYAPRVSFYGRLLNHHQLIREKAHVIRRWPTRHYSLRPGTIRVACDPQSHRCVVRAILDWRAKSAARNAASRGSSTFEQGVDFAASRPLVFRESGSVISLRRTRGRA